MRAVDPARQASLRRHNLGLVLRHVVDAPVAPSRADIAAATGLTRATVSALVDRLVAARLVAELPPVAAQRAGRPAVPLRAASGTVLAVGLEVNVDYLGARVLDLAGDVVAERVEHDDFRGSDPAEVLRRLDALGSGLVAPHEADGATVVGSALALPGLVDRVTGPLRVAPNLGWRDVDVVGLLGRDAAHAPWLGNEANLAARAEARARRLAPDDGASSFVYVSGEVGIGAAIVLDGAIFPGRHGWSGEVGHTVLDMDAADATAPVSAARGHRPGTLEAYAGQDAILARAGLPADASVEDLRRSADAGDARTLEALEVAGRALGVALANVVNVVDVEQVVLGGTHAVLVDHLREPLERELARGVISAPWSPVAVDVARAGPYPALSGAALSRLHAVVEDPSTWGPLAD
ncbi:ROK family transcriptional regulator [Cellulomonas carbonis]|uniref:ROK family transcriptional regulator n=1 Tax=Cellulomonas carbonis T26 TaxID=947969 RepID=A0A0A0BTZ7_9CELL|nr:ROK family transcriptional regulator [Cellulomonas carbonis]KGM11157.1 ROK family transcriptional regulator [Cellulomonas carbonis T26]GGC05060.1 transcriptional regulator [Cellulomonas carbonis]